MAKCCAWLLCAVLLLSLLPLPPLARAQDGQAGDWDEFFYLIENGAASIAIAGIIDIPGYLALEDVVLIGMGSSATLRGGSLITRGNVEMYSLSIESEGDGTAAVCAESGALTLEDVRVFAAYRPGNGMHGVAVAPGSSVLMSDCSAYGGSADAQGGHALYVEGSARVSGGALLGGSGSPGGCGAYAFGAKTLVLEGGASLASEGYCAALTADACSVSANGISLVGYTSVRALSGASISLQSTRFFAQDIPLEADQGSSVAFEDAHCTAQLPEGMPMFQGDGTIIGLAMGLLPPAEIQVALGASRTIACAPEPVDALFIPAVWRTLNPRIASVDAFGCVTGLALGEAAIEVSLPGVSPLTIRVKVTQRPAVPSPFEEPSLLALAQRKKMLPGNDIVITSEEEAAQQGDDEAYVVFTAAPGGAAVFSSPSQSAQRTGHIEEGAFVMAFDEEGEWLRLASGTDEFFVSRRELTAHRWLAAEAGFDALLVQNASYCGANCDEDASLPAASAVRALITVDETTAAAYRGQIVFLPSTALRLAVSPPSTGTVHSAGWTPLLAAAEDAAQTLAFASAGVEVTIASAPDAPEEWLLVKAGRTAGYVPATAVEVSAAHAP